ncbi:MAG: YlbF family regulator [Clostridiales bacterium]|nr:YlbF family regulator [Clostridiales bacterium]
MGKQFKFPAHHILAFFCVGSPGNHGEIPAVFPRQFSRRLGHPWLIAHILPPFPWKLPIALPFSLPSIRPRPFSRRAFAGIIGKAGMIFSLCIVQWAGGNTMQAMDAVKALEAAIQQSPEYLAYAKAKEDLEGDSGIMGLLQEYHRMQTALQMGMLSGKSPDGDAAQRFQQLSMLLFSDNRTAAFLMAEMQLQKMMAEIFERLTRAAGMDLPHPQ